ncbi:MAG: hypothetical protein JWP85_596 [Rhodoglobus sp.]|nr:hypothetical protein [Rhodoglobus sp.]
MNDRRARFTSVTVENFRGVRESRTLDLDASVVIFWGPNGTGKTTIFDALLWLLQGEIPRLASHAMRRNEEYIVSAYRKGGLAKVSAKLRVGGVEYQLVRIGTSAGSTLELTGGEPARSDPERELRRLLAKGDLPLRELMSTSGILQQDDLRLLLRDKPDQRYRQLLRLFGLEVLEQFELQARTWQTEARSTVASRLEALTRQRSRAAGIVERINTLRDLSTSASPESSSESRLVESFVESQQSLYSVHTSPSSAEEFGSLASDALSLIAQIRSTRERIENLPSGSAGNANVERAADVVAQAKQVLAEREAVASAAQASMTALRSRHDDFMTLVALAIPLLQAEPHDEIVECPVCRTRVNSDVVLADLEGRSESGTALADAETRLSDARLAVAQAREVLAAATARLREVEEQRRAAARLAAETTSIRSELRSLTISDPIRVLELADGPYMDGPIDNLLAHRSKLVVRLEQIESSLTELAGSTAFASRRTQTRLETLERRSELPRLEAQLEVLEAETSAAQESYEVSRKEEAAATALLHGVATGTEEIFRERFETVEPLMNDIYSRLDPHPTFTKLDFKIERYRAKGTATASVTDETEDVHANPLLVFSSAQANVVVLSAFLALGWAASSSGLPFVFLDDPLQSLDDVNVLGFADLTRQLRTRKQVLLSTHEERFSRLLERKLGSRTEGEALLIHRFESWNRQGPAVDTRRLDEDSLSDSRVS